MGAPVALASFACLLAFAAPRLLTRGVWLRASPNHGILAWESACAAFVLAVIGAGLTLTAPAHLLVHGLHDLFHACTEAITGLHGESGARTLGATGALLAGLATATATTGVARTVWRNGRERDRHRRATDLVGRALPGADLVCIDVDLPAVYCLAGRPGRIVLTRGALRTLAEIEIAAAVEHEREHLRARHHVVLAFADGLARVLPFVPLVRVARRELRLLVELAADDAAVRRHGRRPLSGAIAAVATSSVPDRALGAGAGDLVSRLERLRLPAPPVSRRAAWVTAALCGLVLLVPLCVTAGTLWRAALDDHCSHPLIAGSHSTGTDADQHVHEATAGIEARY